MFELPDPKLPAGPAAESPCSATDQLNSEPTSSIEPPLLDPRQSLSTMSLEQWLDTLRRTDRAFYNIMALEVWSIAKTMDSLFPGFWHRFMHNRQMAMKQYVALKKQNSSPES